MPLFDPSSTFQPCSSAPVGFAHPTPAVSEPHCSAWPFACAVLPHVSFTKCISPPFCILCRCSLLALLHHLGTTETPTQVRENAQRRKNRSEVTTEEGQRREQSYPKGKAADCARTEQAGSIRLPFTYRHSSHTRSEQLFLTPMWGSEGPYKRSVTPGGEVPQGRMQGQRHTSHVARAHGQSQRPAAGAGTLTTASQRRKPSHR